MEFIAIVLVAFACIAALRITITEQIDVQIDVHEQIMRDSEYEKY